MGDVHDAVLKTHDAARWDLELEVRHDARGIHARHDTAGGTEDLNDLARVLVRALDDGLLDGLHLVAVLVLLKQNAGTADLELKALAAHVLNQYGQMKLTTAGYFVGIRAVRFLDTQRNIGV